MVHKELLGDGSKQAVLQEAVRFIHNRPASGESGIVYCRLRTTCDEMASALRDADIDAASYHAGLDITRRSRVQQDWKDGGYAVVVATIAFFGTFFFKFIIERGILVFFLDKEDRKKDKRILNVCYNWPCTVSGPAADV